MLNRSRALASVAIMALAAGVAAPSWAQETLQEALTLAYRTNPTLLAQECLIAGQQRRQPQVRR